MTSDPNAIGPSASNPVIVAVTTPNAGTVSIKISPRTQTPPSGFYFLNQQIDIKAPPTTSSSPLTIAFTIDPSQLPIGYNENTIQIFKNGALFNGMVPECGTTNPDPCIERRLRMPNGDIIISVLSSNGDPWNIGIPVVMKGDANKDGNITVADALLYLRYAVGQDISPYHIDTSDDVTCDGKITVADALLVLRKSVGQNVNLQC